MQLGGLALRGQRLALLLQLPQQLLQAGEGGGHSGVLGKQQPVVLWQLHVSVQLVGGEQPLVTVGEGVPGQDRGEPSWLYVGTQLF